MTFNANDIIRITTKCSWGTNDVQNVFHLRINNFSDETDADVLDDIAAEMESQFGQVYGLQDSALSYDTVAAYNLTADRYLGEVAWPSLTAGGYATGNALPAQVAGLIRLTTATLGSQGRKFIGGLNAAVLDEDGSFIGSFTNGLSLMASSLLNGLGGADYNATFGNYDQNTHVFRAYTGAIVNSYAAIQRRRRPGVGS